jgi:hypothetical protein
VAGATPCPKNGVVRPPHFWPWGGRPPHTGRMGVAEATPRPLGVVRPPRKAKKKKKKKGKMGLRFWGCPDHPQGPKGGFGHHLPVVGGGRSHPQALGGGPATPKIPNPFFRFFFFFSWWPFGVAGPPPKAWGGFGHPHTADKGWPKPPRFPFFFFFFFLISFFFSKNKKIKPKMPKTTPFWAKRRRFGLAQNGVVLERRVVWTTYHQKGHK